MGEPGDWDDGESGRNGEGATSLWVSQKAWRGITVHELGKNCALADKECRAENTGGLNLRRPLTICTRGPDSWGAADSIFRGAGPRCTGPDGVLRRVTQVGGPGARGCDRRPGGWSAFSPRASATSRATGRRARGFLPLRPSDSPSSLPTGWAPDTASHRRRALSRSKRSRSGSRPSRSSEMLYGRAPPLSAASTVPNAGYSIFPATPNRPIAAPES